MTEILVLSGSLRAESVTTRVASVALAADLPGVTATLAEGLDALPLFNDDLDTWHPPESVAHLRREVAAADAVLFLSPANNGSISAALKNAIDWLSRPRATAPIQGKAAALLVTGYSVDGVVDHLDHVLAAAGARVVRSPGRGLSLKMFGGRGPSDVPAVREAVAEALAALHAGTAIAV
ncbi:NADPH-dependent FMN reductase [Kutzneria buriramensis]|uniref:Chromate reductase n=1 Tax=Kutzneria buriramensis TaxID=1045776 RepID=A0A3E0G655_9PSEU|nr:NAD(P)H-dependent oxidoreductase [Kutzneria buriramensis]REH17943.1 chromate reductase [Kutzneria buriramensis]